MPLISCAHMRLSTEAALLGKAAILCLAVTGGYPGALCLVLWKKDACPCKDEIIA